MYMQNKLEKNKTNNNTKKPEALRTCNHLLYDLLTKWFYVATLTFACISRSYSTVEVILTRGSAVS